MIKRLLILAGVGSAILTLPWINALADDAVPRIALVIGNASYPDADAPLKETVGDARAMVAELKHSGFDVAVGENLGREAMLRTINGLYSSIKPRSIVLVFFSRYGIQSGRQTFMIPIDAQIWTETDVRRDGINLDTVLDEINSRGAGVKLASSLYGRGLARQRSGQAATGDADIRAALQIEPGIANEFRTWGVQ
jgi:hypothetical protein